MGIEPTLFAWEARVLPLNDTRSRRDYRSLAGSKSEHVLHRIENTSIALLSRFRQYGEGTGCTGTACFSGHCRVQAAPVGQAALAVGMVTGGVPALNIWVNCLRSSGES